jgi:hypothetical protein
LALRSRFALLAARTSWTVRTGRAAQPRNSSFAALSPIAVAAVAQRAQALGNVANKGAPHLDQAGAQFGNERVRLRLDQRALALPLLALSVKNITEYLMPSVS